jgi:tetratricopeptide (TPR) repeat protein
MRRQSKAFTYPQEGQYLILGFLFLVFIFSWCLLGHCAEAPQVKAPAEAISKEQPDPKPDISSFIETKDKSPEQMFADANYLYQLGEYESALVLYNKVVQETKDKDLRRRANMGREVIDILTKAEQIGGPKGEKEAKRADKIKERQKKEQVASLYKEAYSRFFDGNLEQASEIFKAILAIEPGEKDAKYYFQDRIPQLIKEQKVKALYKEGLEYFGVGDYANATKLFNEVLAISPDQKAIKDDVEAKLAFIAKMEKIGKLYQQAATVFNGSDYDQAASYCREILAIDQDQPKAKEYLEISIPQKLKERRIAALYKDALAAFNDQELDKARQIFYDILSLDVKQAEAKEYVEIKIPGLLKEQKVKDLIKEGLAAFDDQQYDTAESVFDKALILDPAQAEALEYAQVKIPEVRKQLRIKGIYKDAVESFSVGDYSKAQGLFNDILVLDPRQAEAKEYLEVKIPEKLKLEKINVLYSQAFGDFGRRDFESADAKFKEILAIAPDEKEAQEFVQSKIPQASKEENIERFYKEAMFAFNNGDYESSMRYFEQVLSLDPQERQARIYLEQEIPNRLLAAKEEQERLRLARMQDERKRSELEQQRLEAQRVSREENISKQREKVIQQKESARKQQDEARKQQEEARKLAAEKEAQMEKQKKAAKEKEAILLAKREKPSQLPAQKKVQQAAGATSQQAAKPKDKKEKPKAKPATVKRKPDYPKTGVVGYLYECAFAAYEDGDYDLAKDYFNKILVISPTEATAKDYMAEITKG